MFLMRRIALIILAVCATAVFAGSGLTTSSGAAIVRVRNFFACAPIPVTLNSLVNARLETGDCVETGTNALYDGYTFTGTAGELIDISVSSEVFVPSLRLVQGAFPGGTVIATGTGTTNEFRRITAFAIPSSGTYTIVASTATASGSGAYSLAFESTNPRVDSIQRINSSPAVAGSTLGFSVNFTSSVSGVDATDFVLTTTGVSGASVTNVAGNGSVYTIGVNSGSGAGTIRLDLIDNDTILSGNGVPLGGAGVGNANFTTGPFYTINLPPSGTPTPTPTPQERIGVTNLNDSGPGSLRQAIADVLPGGEVWFNLPFVTPQTLTLTTGEIRITKNLYIFGPGAEFLTISGNNASRVFNIGQSSSGSNVVIYSLRIANGRAPDGDFGGGIEQNFGELVLADCELSGNSALESSAGFGGAIDFFEGRLTILRSKISGNSSSVNGGGIAVANTNVTILDTTIAGNTSGGGGGLHIFGGTATISRSTFSGNTVTNRGGAIFAQNTSISIDNSTLSGNTGDVSAEAIAGALAFEATSGARTAAFTSTTIANNSATPNETGAIRVSARVSSAASATVTFRNSLFAGNSEPAMEAFATGGASSAIVSQGFNLSTGSGNGFFSQPSDRLNAVAGIAPLSNNGGLTETHRLLGESLAVDAGKSFDAEFDQRIFARTVDLMASNANGGDGTDIGALESQSEPSQPFASISGRVTTPAGQNLRNAVVTITGQQGLRRTATTSSFGVYSFAEIPTGLNYFIVVSSKRYRFSPRSVAVAGNLTNVDFVGLE